VFSGALAWKVTDVANRQKSTTSGNSIRKPQKHSKSTQESLLLIFGFTQASFKRFAAVLQTEPTSPIFLKPSQK